MTKNHLRVVGQVVKRKKNNIWDWCLNKIKFATKKIKLDTRK